MELKDHLTTPGKILRHPDPNRPFHLFVDWSTTGISAVLNQRDDDGNYYMIAALSRSLNPHERRYEAFKGEMLAAVWGVKMFRPYLHGSHFYLHTDHRPLLWLLQAKETSSQQTRWILSLQDYEYTLVHRPGVKNVADMPSRYPVASMADTSGARIHATGEPFQFGLPAVLNADLTPDTTDYTFDLLDSFYSTRPRGGDAVYNPAAVLIAGTVPPVSESQLQHQLLSVFTDSIDSEIDTCAPTFGALLAGSNGSFNDSAEVLPDTDQEAAVWRMLQLQGASAEWVCQAQDRLSAMPQSAPLPGMHTGQPDTHGVRHTVQLSTASVSSTYYPAAAQGVVLFEPFGGLCAGLETALRNGTVVKQYYYIDSSPAARRIAAHRIKHLMALYPTLLQASAVQHAFCMPQDIRLLTTEHLVSVVAADGQHQWLVVAGWPCQDLSAAGKAAGLQGERSALLHHLVRVIGALQQLQKSLPPAYIIENVPMQFHPDKRIAMRDFNTVVNMIGNPVVLDAAQFGSLAHRVRNFWCNLCTPMQLAAAASQVVRPAGRTVHLALEPGRAPVQVRAADKPPRYCCNTPGTPMQAWPTFVAHPHSYSFRPGMPGSVITADGDYDQPQQWKGNLHWVTLGTAQQHQALLNHNVAKP